MTVLTVERIAGFIALKDKLIMAVYIFDPPHLMTMVFDQLGEQMPDYQGPWEEVKARVLLDKPDSVQIVDNLRWAGIRDEILRRDSDGNGGGT
jgi:hypothetical protein